MRASAWGNGRLAWLTSGVAQFVLPLASVILAALNLDLAAGVLVLVSAVVTGGLGELRKRSSGPMFGLTSLREDVVEAEITTASGVSTFEDLVDRVHSAVDFWAPALGKHGAALKIDDEDLSRALEAPREATLTERWAVYDNDRYLDQMAFHTRRLLGDRRAAWWWRLGIRALVAVFVFTTAVGIVALITHAASLLGVAAPIGAALYAGWSGLSLAGEQTWLADYWQECLQAFSRCKPPQNREEGAFRTWVLRFERAHREARGRWSAYRGQPQRLEIRD